MSEVKIPLYKFERQHFEEVMKVFSSSKTERECIICQKKTVDRGFYFPNRTEQQSTLFFIYFICKCCREHSVNLNKIEETIINIIS